MTDAPTTYKRSPVVVVGKSVLFQLEKLLPKSAYASLYRLSFDTYRHLLHVLYLRHILFARLESNQDAATKAELVYKVMPYSLVGSSGLNATYDVVYNAEKAGIPGAIVECGVAQGGSASLMALTSKAYARQPREFWLFDSYEGLPDPSTEDYDDEGKTGHHLRPLPKGSCLGTIEQVSELLFDTLKLSQDRIHLVKGWFQDTLPVTHDQIGEIAVLRLDGDWYESTKVCLENLYRHVTHSGYVIIDDYASCYGAQRAVDEFLSENDIHVTLTPDGRGGCVFVKP